MRVIQMRRYENGDNNHKEEESMNHCVPNWDSDNGTLPTSDVASMTKGYWDPTQPKRSMPLEHEIEELLWEKGPVVNKVIKRSRALENNDAVLPGKPASSGKDNVLDAVGHEVRGTSLQEDEVAQLFYYPLDDSFERQYCSEFFEGVPTSGIYTHKDTLPSPSVSASTPINTQREVCILSEGNSNSISNPNSNTTHWSSITGSNNAATSGKAIKEPMLPKPTGNAMTSTIARTSGMTPHSASDTLPRLWTAQSALSKWQANAQNSSCRDAQTFARKNTLQFCGSPAAMPPPGTQAADILPAKSERSKLVNFSHFSRPAATIKANLQSIGSASGLSSTGIRNRVEKLRTDGSSVAEPSIIESNATDWTAGRPSNAGNNNKVNDSNPFLRKNSDRAICSEDGADATAKVADRSACQNSEPGRSFASATTEKVGEVGEAPEPTITSSSGVSGHSGGRTGKEASNNGKRKARDVEDSECQSEDVEFESMDRKPQAPPRTTSKRSRAAEVHNLSERRRRDRINEKMRALQELIPHCNKSDKASMLDEAIEYLKTLQLQVQLMSMGGGVGMTPMVLPGGMQHFQVPQMAQLSPLGMVGMGYSMGMLDIGASSGRSVMPLSPMHVRPPPASSLHCQAATTMPGISGPLQRYAGTGLQLSGHPLSNHPLPGLNRTQQTGLAAASASLSTELQQQMQTSNLMDPYKQYSSQHQLPIAPQVISGHLYNPSGVQQPFQKLVQSNDSISHDGESAQGNTSNPG